MTRNHVGNLLGLVRQKQKTLILFRTLYLGDKSMSMTDLKEFDRDLWNFTERWTAVRLIGEMTSVWEFRIPISTETGQKCVRKLCLDWDAASHAHTGTCPYCKAGRR